MTLIGVIEFVASFHRLIYNYEHCNVIKDFVLFSFAQETKEQSGGQTGKWQQVQVLEHLKRVIIQQASSSFASFTVVWPSYSPLCSVLVLIFAIFVYTSVWCLDPL